MFPDPGNFAQDSPTRPYTHIGKPELRVRGNERACWCAQCSCLGSKKPEAQGRCPWHTWGRLGDLPPNPTGNHIPHGRFRRPVPHCAFWAHVTSSLGWEIKCQNQGSNQHELPTSKRPRYAIPSRLAPGHDHRRLRERRGCK